MEKSWIIRSIRGTRALHGILMVFIGYMLGTGYLGARLVDFVLASLSVFFLWQFTTMLNDIYDIDIDRKAHPERPLVTGEINKKEYKRWAVGFASLGLAFSFLCGLIPFILGTSAILLSVLYSVPPMRIRNRWYGTAIIGIGSGLAFSMGYYSHLWIFDLRCLYIPALTTLALDVLIIIVISLSVAPNITAYRDYDSDMRSGVVSIYTILGKERGKKWVSVSIFFIFLLPSFLFFSAPNIVISTIFGAVASVLFFRYEHVEGVFLSYFVILIYYIYFYFANYI